MIERPKVSVVIPYFDRLPYIERVLRALAEQDASPAEFEIVIGCLEYSQPLLRLLASLPTETRARCVMSREPWNVARARNLAFTHAEGDVLLILDADIVLPRSFLRRLQENHDLSNMDYAIIGQMLNYDAYTDVGEQVLYPYESYRDRYLARDCRDGLKLDSRWVRPRRIPWSLCWTALMAIPRRLVEEHLLYFDSTFEGWGAEDLEWGYRVQRAGIPIVFADDLWGVHLPHARDVRRNCAQQELNYQRLISKWPCFEVEIVTRFGDAVANQCYDELEGARQRVRGSGQAVLSLEFTVGGSSRLALGVVADAAGRLLNGDQIPGIAAAQIVRQVPLLGMRLPYADHALQTTYMLPSLADAPGDLQDLIRAESLRISGEAIRL